MDGEHLEMASLTGGRSGLHLALGQEEQAADTSRQSSLNAAEFYLSARAWFLAGDAGKERGVAKALGATWTLQGSVLSIEPHPMLVRVTESIPRWRRSIAKQRPNMAKSNPWKAALGAQKRRLFQRPFRLAEQTEQ